MRGLQQGREVRFFEKNQPEIFAAGRHSDPTELPPRGAA
jgi:hypothetical protein